MTGLLVTGAGVLLAVVGFFFVSTETHDRRGESGETWADRNLVRCLTGVLIELVGLVLIVFGAVFGWSP